MALVEYTKNALVLWQNCTTRDRECTDCATSYLPPPPTSLTEVTSAASAYLPAGVGGAMERLTDAASAAAGAGVQGVGLGAYAAGMGALDTLKN